MRRTLSRTCNFRELPSEGSPKIISELATRPMRNGHLAYGQARPSPFIIMADGRKRQTRRARGIRLTGYLLQERGPGYERRPFRDGSKRLTYRCVLRHQGSKVRAFLRFSCISRAAQEHISDVRPRQRQTCRETGAQSHGSQHEAAGLPKGDVIAQ